MSKRLLNFPNELLINIISKAGPEGLDFLLDSKNKRLKSLYTKNKKIIVKPVFNRIIHFKKKINRDLHDILSSSEDMQDALMSASYQEKLGVVKWILENAEFGYRGHNEINNEFVWELISQDDISANLIKLFLAYNFISAEDALIYASIGGRFDLVKLLVKRGADVTYNNSDALVGSLYFNHPDITMFLIKHGAIYPGSERAQYWRKEHIGSTRSLSPERRSQRSNSSTRSLRSISSSRVENFGNRQRSNQSDAS